MISDKMKELVKSNSVIREMFEEGKKLAKKYGEENVYDFSLGNPSIPTPEKVNNTIREILENENSLKVHGYMNNAGFEDVREKIAENINNKFDTNFSKENIVMCVGAASGINIILKSILNPKDEVITYAPYFMEYKNYINSYDGKLIEISPDTKNFQPKLDEFENKITEKTKAVIINTPNNPTGVVYSEETIKDICKILEKKQKQFGKEIFIISDEPYREIVYDNITVPYITKYYNNTFVVYSYSKTLSIPGERIGYIVIPTQMNDSKNIITAVTIANRIIGCVNAPSLMQRVLINCSDEKVDLKVYDENRKLLYNELTKYGFECIKPQGAFYLFLKSPIENDLEFCKKAKEYNLLFVPGSSFSCKGYVRIAYCVSNEMIKRSLPAFKKLAGNYINI
ncbi:MAG: pyridoxal phosphate-dependent aminotransferase [Clostridia bacterium]|nr:pyridoxal phosphate-dependent aminotransferase [Clostridia bacterium]